MLMLVGKCETEAELRHIQRHQRRSCGNESWLTLDYLYYKEVLGLKIETVLICVCLLCLVYTICTKNGPKMKKWNRLKLVLHIPRWTKHRARKCCPKVQKKLAKMSINGPKLTKIHQNQSKKKKKKKKTILCLSKKRTEKDKKFAF